MFGGIRRSFISLKANDPHLSNLISEEKEKITAIKASSLANTSAAKFLALWGEQEHKDIKDISTMYSEFYSEFSLIILEWERKTIDNKMRRLNLGRNSKRLELNRI